MMGAPYNVNGLLARSLMMGCAAPSAVPRLEQFEATGTLVVVFKEFFFVRRGRGLWFVVCADMVGLFFFASLPVSLLLLVLFSFWGCRSSVVHEALDWWYLER